MQIYADVHAPAAAPDRLRAGAGARRRRCTRRSPPACTPTSAPPRRRWARSGATPTCPTRARADAYDELYAHYSALHDHFGRGGDDVMHRLRRHRGSRRMIDADSQPRRGLRAARRAAAQRARRLDEREPVGARAGRGADGDQGRAASPYDELTPESMVVCDLARHARRGRPRAVERRRHARLRLPPPARGRRHRAHAQPLRDGVGGARRADPVRADRDGRRVRRRDPGRAVRADRRRGDRPRGRRDAGRHRSPAVLMRSHGVFTVGAGPREAIKAAVMCEDVARTVHLARSARRADPARPERTSMRSTTATRTSTASAERRAPRRGRGSACSGSCRSSTTRCCPASPSARRRYAEELAAALGRRGRRASSRRRSRTATTSSARCASSRARTSTACWW